VAPLAQVILIAGGFGIRRSSVPRSASDREPVVGRLYAPRGHPSHDLLRELARAQLGKPAFNAGFGQDNWLSRSSPRRGYHSSTIAFPPTSATASLVSLGSGK
jgi:hypothetical protein